MLNIATFDEVKEFANLIRNINNDNDVKRAFDYFNNNIHFHNEYNLKQLKNIIKATNVSNHKNEKLVLKLITKLIENFPSIWNGLLDIINFPGRSIIEVIDPDEDEQGNKVVNIYKRNFMSENMKPYTIINIKCDNKLVVSFKVLDNDNKTKISMSKLAAHMYGFNIYKSPSIKAVISFSDIENLHISPLENNFIPLNDIETAIKNDDADKLRDLLINKVDINKANYITDLPISAITNHLARHTISELILMYGSIKCFKFVMMSNMFKANRITDSAVIVGGNLEILHIMEQNNLFYNIDGMPYNIIKYGYIDMFVYWCNRYKIHDINGLLVDTMETYNYDMFEYMLNTYEFQQHQIFRSDLFIANFEAIDKITSSYENYPIGTLSKLPLELLRYMVSKGYRLQKDDKKDDGTTNSLLYVVHALKDINIIKFIANELYGDVLPLDIRKKIAKTVLYLGNKTRIIEILEFVKVSEFINDTITPIGDFSPLVYYVAHNTIQTIHSNIVAYLVDNGARTIDNDGKQLIDYFKTNNIIRIKDKSKYNTIAHLLKSTKRLPINEDEKI